MSKCRISSFPMGCEVGVQGFDRGVNFGFLQSKKMSKNDNVQKFVYGGLSCMTAALFTNPIDVIKIRLQLQVML